MAKDKYILHIADHAHKTKTHDYNEDSKELLDDNVCRTDCRSRLPVGATEVDGNGGQHGGIVAGDGGAADIEVAEVADISCIGVGVAAGAHHPEGVAPVGIHRRPPRTATLGVECGAESLGGIVDAAAGVEAVGGGGGRGLDLIRRKKVLDVP